MSEIVGLRQVAGEKLLVTSRHERIWFCDGCRAAFKWDENSSYYGSVRDTEDQKFKNVWIACSDECASLKPADFPGKRKKANKQTPITAKETR